MFELKFRASYGLKLKFSGDDSGTGGGISASRNTAGGSENIMNGAAAIANNNRKDNERW